MHLEAWGEYAACASKFLPMWNLSGRLTSFWLSWGQGYKSEGTVCHLSSPTLYNILPRDIRLIKQALPLSFYSFKQL